jgi:RNA polymerase sigma factor (sigma-70 family)
MPKSDGLLREVRRFVAAARPDDDSDRHLLNRFATTRDDRAFAELVRRHGPMVLGVCRRVLRHAADADDAFQATFLILVRRAADVRDPDRLGPWLFGVAWRVATKLRTTRPSASSLPDDLPARQPHAGDWPAELDAAIARLPEKYRSPVVLCHLQGLTATEAARQLGCPPATVATRLFRARDTLRRRLTALGLAVPVALVAESTLHLPTALAAATRELAAGRTISPAAVRLADGALRNLLMAKVRWAATAAAVCLTTVGVLGFRAGGQEPGIIPSAPPPSVPEVVAPPPAQTDRDQSGTVRSANFQVTAPSARIARLVADTAERTRKDAAVAWLGKEQPPRAEICRITVIVSHQGSGGATTFNFDGGKVTADMHVEGELDRLLADQIPHEVTHVVLADHFRKPLPRWADEGIALLSESEDEQARNLQYLAQAAAQGDLIQIKALCAARDYPENVMTFYAESYCLAKVLVDRKDRATLVGFVRDGMKDGWESAAKVHYGASLDDLEREMIGTFKSDRKGAGSAGRGPTDRSTPVFRWATADASDRVTVYERVGHFYEPVTTYVRRDLAVKGGSMPQSYMEPVTTYQPRTKPIEPMTIARGQVRAATPDGKPIAVESVIQALKGKTVAVVVVKDLDHLDKAFAELLKPDTMILFVPSMKGDPVPPSIKVELPPPPTIAPGM